MPFLLILVLMLEVKISGLSTATRWERLRLSGANKTERGQFEIVRAPIIMQPVTLLPAADFAFSFDDQHLRCRHESFATRH
jgi:hypothetical protein